MTFPLAALGERSGNLRVCLTLLFAVSRGGTASENPSGLREESFPQPRLAVDHWISKDRPTGAFWLWLANHSLCACLSLQSPGLGRKRRPARAVRLAGGTDSSLPWFSSSARPLSWAGDSPAHCSGHGHTSFAVKTSMKPIFPCVSRQLQCVESQGREDLAVSEAGEPWGARDPPSWTSCEGLQVNPCWIQEGAVVFISFLAAVMGRSGQSNFRRKSLLEGS